MHAPQGTPGQPADGDGAGGHLGQGHAIHQDPERQASPPDRGQAGEVLSYPAREDVGPPVGYDEQGALLVDRIQVQDLCLSEERRTLPGQRPGAGQPEFLGRR